MTTLLAAALAAFVASGPAAAQTADDRWDARVTAVTGEVTVTPADGSEPAAASEGMPLEQGDRVTTAAGATAEIALDGESLITLQENSDFTLESTAKSDSTFSLALGSLLAKIQKLGERRLQVRTPTAVAAVRGTEFGVDVEDGEQSHVGVFDEGRVEVKSDGGAEVLNANQETSARKGAAPLKPFALKRFAARRQMMRARIRRLASLRRAWRRMAPGQRKRARLEALKRRVHAIRERRRELNREQAEQRRRLRQERRPRRGPKPNNDQDTRNR